MLSRFPPKDKHFNDLELLVHVNQWFELPLLERGNHSVRKFLGTRFASDVARRMFCLAVDLFKGMLDSLRSSSFAKVAEHQNAAHQQGRWISESLASDIGRGTMNGLEHGAFVPDVGAGNNAQAANKAGRQVAHDVAVKIRRQKHAKLPRIQDNLHAAVLNDEFLIF